MVSNTTRYEPTASDVYQSAIPNPGQRSYKATRWFNIYKCPIEGVGVTQELVPGEFPQDRLLGGLEFVWLEITPRCNLQCQHCYVSASPWMKDPGSVDWNWAIDESYRLGCRKIQFIGGEPTLHPQLGSFVSRAQSIGFEFIEVFSNLMAVSDQLLERFLECGVNVATSFYSWDPEIHDLITGSKGSFGRTLSGIRRVLAHGIPLRVGLILMESNKHEAGRTMSFLADLGIDRGRIKIDEVRPVGRGQSLAQFEGQDEALCGSCWQGKLAISYDGSVYPCVFSRYVSLGNVNQDKLSDMLSSEKLKEFRTRIHRLERERKMCGPNCDPDLPPGPGTCNPSAGCTPGCNPCSP